MTARQQRAAQMLAQVAHNEARAFAAAIAPAETALRDAGWTEAGGAMISRHGDLIKVRCNDPRGRNYSACGTDLDQILAELFAAIDAADDEPPVLVSEGVPVGNTLPDHETEAKLEAALEELEAVRRELDGFRKLPEPGELVAPSWLDVAEGETVAQAAHRYTQELKRELSNLTNKRLDGQRVDEARVAEINRLLEDLTLLGDA